MKRMLNVGVAQLGPIARNETRSDVVARLIKLLTQAGEKGCNFVAFPELALTTFFPRWFFEDGDAELASYYEKEMPGAETQPLFDKAAELGIGFYLGYAELTTDEQGNERRFNTSILVDDKGTITGKYRKIHLPGHKENETWRPFQHLEKRYFEVGDTGFNSWDFMGGKVGMALCNDRRWPETYRVMALQGAEMIVLGYNTPMHYPPVPQHDHLQGFHNHVVMQASAYQNGCWIIACAKAGKEEGCDLLGQSCIIAPTGEIVAMATTVEDELIVGECDFERTREIKEHIFNFDLHRVPEEYKIISAPKK
ncbi:N-carbamoyl-D-amino-acid hydrolase [Reinekea marinisedimentorum]|uniref:Putative amidohydrolase n=1 Tax=Reinekea marinisedimentorum TaxID=230495 RepID=A0A4R3HUH7_9GAMM|nr:N-carbamoyl-D-amino-acid hydrolase [Reinekea marinisedimentorum]TCS35665.1 putative amidohydrolase [Reinekea marinisedimentorum]